MSLIRMQVVYTVWDWSLVLPGVAEMPWPPKLAREFPGSESSLYGM